jgi:CubicO group peptidase (beta-lactamase class C family)
VAEDEVDIWKLAWVGPLTVAASLLAVFAVRVVAFSLLDLNPEYPPLTPIGLTLFTTVLVLLGVIVFFIVIWKSATPIRTYRRIALVALILSCIPDLFLPGQVQGGQPVPGATWTAAIVLMVMHVAAWVPVRLILTNPMLIRLTLIVLFVASMAPLAAADPLPVAKPESVGLSSARLERLAQLLRADVERGRMPGAVIAISRRGKLVYHEAFGFSDKAAGKPMAKDSIFVLASMTKPMVAVATLMLTEQGDLLLNDPVGNYLPALKDMKVATATGTATPRRQPTLQDMLRHTAGVTNANRGDSALHKLYASRLTNADGQTGAKFLEELGKLPLHYEPGTVWDYSYGLDVAALAVEAVTKKRFGEFLQERLFAPLGMVDTGFMVPAAKAGRIAKPLPIDLDTGKPPTFREPVKPWQYDCGGGCAQGTATDYMRFALMLLNKGALDGTRILSRKSVEYMTSDHLGPNVDASRLHEFAVEHIDGFGFGLGVAVRRETGRAGVMGTPGEFLWSGAQGTTFWVDPKEELAVVFLANTPGPIRRHYREVVKMLVEQAIVD